jgi:hypothetical protein
MNSISGQFLQRIREKLIYTLVLISPLVKCSAPQTWTNLFFRVVHVWTPNGSHGISCPYSTWVHQGRRVRWGYTLAHLRQTHVWRLKRQVRLGGSKLRPKDEIPLRKPKVFFCLLFKVLWVVCFHRAWQRQSQSSDIRDACSGWPWSVGLYRSQKLALTKEDECS